MFTLLLTLSLCIAIARGDSPWYYHGLDGPVFSNTTVDNDVQVRAYEANLWASTIVLGSQLNVDENIGLKKLEDCSSIEFQGSTNL